MATAYDLSENAFDNAIRNFKKDLNDNDVYNEILKCTSIDDVYDATDSLQQEQKKKGHLRHLSKIQPYLENLRDYGGVIEVFMQAKPDALCFIWGPIKLLLQWTSVLKQSFDAIIDTTAEIGSLLPEFKRVAELFKQNSQIKDVLVLFFKDILDFYGIALKFFQQTRWKFFFESVWPRHRDKIKVVMNNIERHTSLLRNEVRLEHIQEEHQARIRAFQHYEDSERSHRLQEYYAIQNDISPLTFDQKLDWLLGRICVGTAKWLFEDFTFKKWLDLPDRTRMLWLQGIPGAGKTFLSSAVVEKLKRLGRCVYGFLSHTISTDLSALSILHSLIFQLASGDDDLRDVVCQSMKDSLKSDIEAATNLLKTLIGCTGIVYIVIDGLDEIDEVERKRFLRQLYDVSQVCENAKILISSRAEADIAEILKDTPTIRVDNGNHASIQAFVDQRIQQWFRDSEFLPEAEAKIRGLLAPLASTSKGMFLYAKVVMANVESLEDTEEILNELTVLPENLDDAYARILSRINNLKPPALKEKAQNILGWVACCPTPLMRQEIEQLLTIKQDDLEGNTSVVANVNIVKICGPVVEIVDDYVELAHFTFKEYLFSSQTPCSIKEDEATLSLAMRFITYLCQRHHEESLPDEQVAGNILRGLYRLDWVATSTWFKVLELYIRLRSQKDLSSELIDALEALQENRTNVMFESESETATYQSLNYIKRTSPGLYTLLCKVAHFRHLLSHSHFSEQRSSTWTNLDPLTLSKSSVRISEKLKEIMCTDNKHENCQCQTIKRHYGQRPFKCSIVNCTRHRYGFESNSLRKLHMRHHAKPWKCTEEGCEFSEGGFLSRKMRDDHLAFHQKSHTPLSSSLLKTSSNDEMLSLLYDLVKADEVDAVNALKDEIRKLKPFTRTELCKYVSTIGSRKMFEQFLALDFSSCFFLFNELVQNKSSSNVKFLLEKIQGRQNSGEIYASVLQFVIEMDSEEIFAAWEKHADFEAEVNECMRDSKFKNQWSNPGLRFYNSTISGGIAATDGHHSREESLLSIWARLKISKTMSPPQLCRALSKVAETTCSVRLAKYLIESGADVDGAENSGRLTPLHHAARKDSAEAAELMKFLLFQGADPGRSSKRSVLSIREEKGAKNIQKWLGISFDELVTLAREERAKNPPLDRTNVSDFIGKFTSLDTLRQKF